MSNQQNPTTMNKEIPADKLYRCVKASERLPDSPGKHFCIKIDTGERTICRFSKKIGKQSIFHRQPNNIEWLEEIESPDKELIEALEQVVKGQNGELKGQFIARIRSIAKTALNKYNGKEN